MGQSLRTNASCDLARREEKRKKKKKEKKRKVFQRHEISWSLTSFHVIRYTEFRCGACFNDSHDRLDLNYDTFKPLTQKFFLDLSVDYYQ